MEVIELPYMSNLKLNEMKIKSNRWSKLCSQVKRWKFDWYYYKCASKMMNDEISVIDFLRFQLQIVFPFAFLCKLTKKHKWEMETGGDAETGPITDSWCTRCGKSETHWGL
jgi:hypothetical protein